jgi:hypothetical protein
MGFPSRILYKLIEDELIRHEKYCSNYGWALLMRDLGWKLADFDKEFDLREFQFYYLRRDERINNA